MLHTKILAPGALSVLRRLMEDPAMGPFYLVGGTALALRFGHRLSVDLDLFRDDPFDVGEILAHLRTWPGFREVSKAPNTLNVFIAGVKVDLISYPYPRLEPITVIDGIRLLDEPDLAAMKLSAVCSRGRKKDFFDIAALLDRHPLKLMLDWFGHKYEGSEPFMVVRSLSYFGDAENDPDPGPLDGTDWESVKQQIEDAVAEL
jgi:hypothetical protein